MKTKHTTGPWFHALQAGTETQHFIYGPQGKPRIAEVLGNLTEQIVANARLIAATPELLEALANLLHYDTFEQVEPKAGTREYEVISMARAAIAKATEKD